jgi:hypothetical protein
LSRRSCTTKLLLRKGESSGLEPSSATSPRKVSEKTQAIWPPRIGIE